MPGHVLVATMTAGCRAAMAGALLTEQLYGHAPTNHAPLNVIRQAQYLEKVMAALDGGGESAAAVVADLVLCRSMITKLGSMRLHVATDLLQQAAATPYQTLSMLLLPVGEAAAKAEAEAYEEGTPPNPPPAAAATPLPQLRSSQFVKSNANARSVLGLSVAENSTLRSGAPGLGAHDPSLPALLVAIEHLTGLEGDFWCKIRGLGLSYGYHIANSVEAQRLSFSLSRSTDPVKAYAAAREIVSDYAEGKSAMTDTDLESTKSAVIFGIVDGADTKSAAVSQEWWKLFGEESLEYERKLMASVLAVTKAQALEALRTHLVPLFDQSSSTLTVVTPTNKVGWNAAAFHDLCVSW
jgi:Zn-dependent M16 (insulinase) family peptidase